MRVDKRVRFCLFFSHRRQQVAQGFREEPLAASRSTDEGDGMAARCGNLHGTLGAVVADNIVPVVYRIVGRLFQFGIFT